MLSITLQFEDGGEERLQPIPLDKNVNLPITRIRTIAGITIDISHEEERKEITPEAVPLQSGDPETDTE